MTKSEDGASPLRALQFSIAGHGYRRQKRRHVQTLNSMPWRNMEGKPDQQRSLHIKEGLITLFIVQTSHPSPHTLFSCLSIFNAFPIYTINLSKRLLYNERRFSYSLLLTLMLSLLLEYLLYTPFILLLPFIVSSSFGWNHVYHQTNFRIHRSSTSQSNMYTEFGRCILSFTLTPSYNPSLCSIVELPLIFNRIYPYNPRHVWLSIRIVLFIWEISKRVRMWE